VGFAVLAHDLRALAVRMGARAQRMSKYFPPPVLRVEE